MASYHISTASRCLHYCRYTVEKLLELACQHGELRTLQRTLAAGGERGIAALMDICNRLSQPPDQTSDKQQGSAVDALPVQDRLQFVQRCHLAMHRPDLAGALKSSGLHASDSIHERLVRGFINVQQLLKFCIARFLQHMEELLSLPQHADVGAVCRARRQAVAW